MRIQDPGDGSGGAGGGGSPSSPWVELYPNTLGVAQGATPVSIVPTWGNCSPTLSAAPPMALPSIVNGQPFVVAPSATTTFTLSGGGGVIDTCVVTVGVPTTNVLRYVDLRWTFSEPFPQGSVVGFEVVLFLGADVTNTDMWIEPPIRCAAVDRRLVYPVRLKPPADLNAGLRVLYEYGSRTSDWKVLPGTLTFI